MNAPIPKNEEVRLQALYAYAVLDTEAERAYDDITQLAAYICRAPLAFISLVDRDRLWFKSCVGTTASQMPREHTFCGYAILDPLEVMVVPDANRDERFAENPLVRGEPYIRFYAGAPLVTPSGEALGTLCVVDTVARALDPKDAQALQALAREVVAQLELRRMVEELARSTEHIEAMNRQLAALSVTDSLTGIKNRRALDEKLDEEMTRAIRTGTHLSYLLVDIDNFKSYNDDYGHVAGDEALRKVAEALQSNARVYDLVARYGGEEFAVLLPDSDSREAGKVADRLRLAIENMNGTNRAITISIGVATSRAEQTSAMLVSEADKALYRAKQSGRNRVVHSESMP